MSKNDLKSSASPETIVQYLSNRHAEAVNCDDTPKSQSLEEIVQKPDSPRQSAFFTSENQNRKGEQLLTNVFAHLLDIHCGQAAQNMSCHFYYNPEYDHYTLEVDALEDVSNPEKEEAETAITDLLVALKPFADKDCCDIHEHSGQIFIDTKMELLDLMTDYFYSKDIPIDFYSSEQKLSLLPAQTKSDASPDSVRSILFQAFKRATDSIAQNPEHRQTLLMNAFMRPYINHESYLALAQIQYEELNQNRLYLSTMILLAEEKIKYEERRDPRIPKGLVLPCRILN